jgi:cyclophilin family peptidyl-prolyl cis-trans isomerase
MLRTRALLWLCISLGAPRAIGAEEHCKDEHEACKSWAEAGECKKNKGFMSNGCPVSCGTCPKPLDPALTELGDEIVSMEIEGYGTIELGFYPNAAPVTVAHIVNLFRLGCYDTNHIFRVDKGFVAQVQSVGASSSLTPLSAECLAESRKTVPGEFTAVRHVRGTLSMGRMDDPDSGGSSFSMLLGRAPHLDQTYTVFGKVLSGDEVLTAIEKVETKREGIFVMPKSRITIKAATVARHRSEL